MTDAAAAIVALLKGDAHALAALDALPNELVGDTARREGLAPLVADRLAALNPRASALPSLSEEARRDAVQDVLRQRALPRVLRGFEAAAVPVIVFKGEHLAYLCYERPELRPRVDSDLLIRPADRARAQQVLEAAGYEKAAQLEADLISYQCSYVERGRGSGGHVVDLHWRVANPPEFGGALEVDELFDRAMVIPQLGRETRGPGLSDALLLSVIHPVAHHRGRNRLLWDLDTALLASRMTSDSWAEFLTVVTTRGLAGLCQTRLARAIDLFAAPVPPMVMKALVEAGARGGRSLAAREPRTQASGLLLSLRALPRWADRAALARQHLLPPRDYMRRVYAPASRSPLAFLYMQRAVVGFWKYCRRPH